MTQTTICIRLDENLKKEFEEFCSSTGMSMSTAINIFIKKSVREQRIPFEINTGDEMKETQRHDEYPIFINIEIRRHFDTKKYAGKESIL